MTLNHNYGYFSGVGSGIAGNYLLTDKTFGYLLNINPKSEGNRIKAENK